MKNITYNINPNISIDKLIIIFLFKYNLNES